MKQTNILTLAAFTLFTAPAFAENPYAQEDNSWISINGKVTSVSADEFELDYGEGVVTVEMDDGDRDADGYKLLKGDEVRVSGLIEDEFFELTKIDASSVYVKNIDTYFYASSIDQEDYGYTVISPVMTDTFLEGTISSVSADDEKFTLNTGSKELTVEVDELRLNPLDNEGYQQLDVGDRVRVNGEMDDDFFEGRVFEANYVTSIGKKQNKATQTAESNMSKEQAATTDQASSGGESKVHQVEAVGLMFSPLVMKVQPGDRVSWTNMPTHNVNTEFTTSEGVTEYIPDGAEGFTSSMGVNFTTEPLTVEGVYLYKCDPHWGAGMGGVIIVGEPTNMQDIVDADPKGALGRLVRKAQKVVE